ncbi:MAG: hypothetical protein B7Z80_02390 [Rhodospirillales bacterium 20-64-7]|nr:MAG: hypothetical protein B7Z80_02390 [Rhodospirillales bacterium 20-64-7]HQT76023.1 hypothetical protein [Rhodopila sp.]
MRFYSLAVFGASVALMAAPAFAENSGHNSGSSMSSQSQGSNQSQGAEQGHGNIRQNLVQSLQKAGFTHVRVEPEVFVVHARNSQGEPVLMRISPDSMEAVTAMQPANQGSSSGMNHSGQQHASANSGSGTTTTQ